MLDKFTKEEIKTAIDISKTYTEILKNLKESTAGNKYKSLKSVIARHDIDLTEFNLRRDTHIDNVKIPKVTYTYDQILIEDSQYSSSNLKKRLVRDKLIVDICVECGIGNVWNKKPIILQLDHINGKHNDNRIENLRILCPNCHSQTSNYSNKSTGKFCKQCSNKIHKTNKSGLCQSCSRKGNKNSFGKNRRVERPPKEVLLDLLRNNAYDTVGKMYGVSGNAIRKWLK